MRPRIGGWEGDRDDHGRSGCHERPKPHLAIERPRKEAKRGRPMPASGHGEAATLVLKKIPLPDVDVVILIWSEKPPDEVFIGNRGCTGGILSWDRVQSMSLPGHQPDHDQDATQQDAGPDEQPADDSFPSFKHRRLCWCGRGQPCSKPRYLSRREIPVGTYCPSCSGRRHLSGSGDQFDSAKTQYRKQIASCPDPLS